MRRMTALVFVLLVAAGASASDKVIHQTAQLNPNGRLSVDTHNGTVTVSAWNRPDVDIQARVEETFNVSASDVSKTDIAISGSGNSVTVKTDYSGVNGWNMFGGQNLPPVHYTISMPATAALKISAHNAEVRVRGLRSDVDIDTHNGGVDVSGLEGAARVETHNGSVKVAFARFAKGSKVETHNGSIDLVVPQASRFRIEAEGHHLTFDSDFPATTHGYGRDHFTGDVNGGGPELQISTHNGSVRIRKS